MAAVKQRVIKPIHLKRLIQFHGSPSLGITLPSNFVHRLGLVAGEFVKCEINRDGTSMTVEEIGIGGLLHSK